MKPAALQQAEREGVTVVLNDQGRPVVRGGNPSPVLIERLKLQRDAIIGHLSEQPRGGEGDRWGEVPTTGIVYRHDCPDLTDDQARALTAWALRQPRKVIDWLQRRSTGYFERHPNTWPMPAYEHAAALDLARWQTGQDAVPAIAFIDQDNEQPETQNEEPGTKNQEL